MSYPRQKGGGRRRAPMRQLAQLSSASVPRRPETRRRTDRRPNIAHAPDIAYAPANVLPHAGAMAPTEAEASPLEEAEEVLRSIRD